MTIARAAIAGRRLGSTYFERAIRADGTCVVVRPIIPADASGIQALLKHLSQRTRYLRFHGPRTEFSAEELRFLTEIDGENHFALGAFTPSRPRLVAVGRFIRGAAGAAELALVVCDELQGKGLGELLLSRLRAAALERGIALFTGSMVDDNRPMRRLLRKLGGRVGLSLRGVCDVELALG